MGVSGRKFILNRSKDTGGSHQHSLFLVYRTFKRK